MTLALILAATFVTALISGVFGMAGGLILMGVLAVLLPVPAAMVVHGVIQTVSNGWRAVLHIRWVDWRILGIYMIGSASAAGLLAFAAFQLPKPWLFVLLGLVPAAIWLPRRWVHFDAARPAHAIGCGFIVTGLNVVAGVSGPLLDVFFIDTERDRRAIVATKAATQVVSHGVKIAYYILPALAAGDLPRTYWLALAAPLAIGGTTLGARALAAMNDVQFRRWTRWIVTAIGAVYIVRGVVQLAAS